MLSETRFHPTGPDGSVPIQYLIKKVEFFVEILKFFVAAKTINDSFVVKKTRRIHSEATECNSPVAYIVRLLRFHYPQS